MKLSVVILNYNVRYFLQLCISSVVQATKEIDSEIIVVDNNSSDDSCKMVRKYFPEVKLIENAKNLGYSKGNNIGVEVTRGEYVCILNPDTVVAEDTFRKLINFSEGRSNMGIVGCRLVNGKGVFLPESKRNVPIVSVALQKLFGFSQKYYANHLNENEIGRASVLVGAFMLMRRTVYKKCGGFDEDYFMYGEDIDLSYRVEKLGLLNYYFGDSTAVHYKGESTLRDKNYAKRFYGAMQVFYNKHFRKYFLFNMIVRVGLKLAYAFRSQHNSVKTAVSTFYYRGKSCNRIQDSLKKKMHIDCNASLIEENAEIIFDANDLSYKEIISEFGNPMYHSSLTYKIIPRNSDFLIGSNDTISRGEVITFD